MVVLRKQCCDEDGLIGYGSGVCFRFDRWNCFVDGGPRISNYANARHEMVV
jgi:hypothetical protein